MCSPMSALVQACLCQLNSMMMAQFHDDDDDDDDITPDATWKAG
jgi:hypothetical protein